MPKSLQIIIIVFSVFLIAASISVMIIYNKPVKKTEVADIGGDFLLHDMNGNIFNSKGHRDKYWLVYFGFTNCPDVCPNALYNMADLLTKLGKNADKFLPLFITIDPSSDKHNYNMNHTSFIYLIGKDGQYITYFASNDSPETMYNKIISNKNIQL